MTAGTLLRGAVLGLLGLGAGCMSVGRPIDGTVSNGSAESRRDESVASRDRGKSRDSSAKAARATGKRRGAESEDDEDPFRRREEKTPRSRESDIAESASWNDSDDPPPRKKRDSIDPAYVNRSTERRSPGKLPPMDEVTRELLDAELREATPQERDELLQSLEGLDPSMMRPMVTMHRLSRQMAKMSADRDSPAPRGGSWADSEFRRDARIDRAAAYDESPRTSSPWSGPAHIDASALQGTRPRASEGLPGSNGPLGSSAPSASPFSRSISPPGPSNSVGGPNAGPGPNPFAASTGTSAGFAPRDDRGPSSASGAGPGPLPRGADASRWQYANDPQASRSAIGLPIVPVGHNELGGGQPIDRLAAANPSAGTPFSMNRGAGNGGIGAMPLGPASVGQPAPASSDRYLEELQRLIAAAELDAGQFRLTRESSDADRQRYIEKHVHLRMLYLMAGQQERALQAIPGIDAADQEFWQQMFWAVANYFDAQNMPNRGDRATQAAAQLRTAIQRLQETARLELRNVAFCHEITSYGAYQRFPRDEFTRGQPVLVYAEVNNFKSVPAADGQYLTRLRSTIELYTPAGGLIDRIVFPEQEDVCRNHRRDYFQSHQFNIPNGDKIQLGPHVLKVLVEDLLSQKVAEYSVNFTVK